MNSVRKTAVVPFSAEQMYALVNDVESYPAFLPWCSDARILSREGESLTASIELSSAGIHQQFTTRNVMQPGRRIDLELLSGPFRRLQGNWQFHPEGTSHCRIEFALDFEFRNRALQFGLSRAFHFIVESLVDAFKRRAEQVYG